MIDIPDDLLPQDSGGRPLCPRCLKIISVCACPDILPRVGSKSGADKAELIVRLERKNRQGKTVTVISGFDAVEASLNAVSTRLKRACGGGGTCYVEQGVGIVEVQGDQRERVMEILSAEGHNVRRGN